MTFGDCGITPAPRIVHTTSSVCQHLYFKQMFDSCGLNPSKIAIDQQNTPAGSNSPPSLGLKTPKTQLDSIEFVNQSPIASHRDLSNAFYAHGPGDTHASPS